MLVIWVLTDREGALSYKELQKFKEAAEKIARECDTPEKVREFFVKSGYLKPNGEVAEKFR
jgi:hypothetical protein